MKIVRRKLEDQEIKSLIADTKSFPDLTYVSKSRWQSFASPYVLEIDNSFAGVCIIYELTNLVKIGPLVILKKYQGKGYGKILMKKVIDDNNDKNLYIGSSCPILSKIVIGFGFKKVTVFSLPKEIKLFLIKQLFDYLSFNLITEAVRKRLNLKRGKYGFFVK